jgi:hypothetical protein
MALPVLLYITFAISGFIIVYLTCRVRQLQSKQPRLIVPKRPPETVTNNVPYQPPVPRIGESPWIGRKVNEIMDVLKKQKPDMEVRVLRAGGSGYTTLDYSFNRINISVDEKDYITAISYY